MTRRVLVVEDDPKMAEAVKRAPRDEGHEVEVATLPAAPYATPQDWARIHVMHQQLRAVEERLHARLRRLARMVDR